MKATILDGLGWPVRLPNRDQVAYKMSEAHLHRAPRLETLS